MSAPAEIDRLLRRAADDPDVLAVLLFGSVARGEAGGGSDVDGA
jgi:predicted nucleotidyltransferase